MQTDKAPVAPSPLWIFALFLGLVEVVVTVSAVNMKGLGQGEVIASGLVLAVGLFATFVWLLVKHKGILYSPEQFRGVDIEAYMTGLNDSARDRETVLVTAVAEAIAVSVVEKLGTRGAFDAKALGEEIGADVRRRVSKSSVVVDVTPIDPGKGVLEIPVTSDTTVDSLLDSIYFAIRPAFQPRTYNKEWVLLDDNLKSLTEMGTEWAKSQGMPRDSRRLEVAGIGPGSRLTLERKVPTAARPSQRPTGGRSGRRLPDEAWREGLRQLVFAVTKDVEGHGWKALPVKGPHRPRLIATDGQSNFGLYAMSGEPLVGWVDRAIEACAAAAQEQRLDVEPALVLDAEPTEAVASEADARGVRIIRYDGQEFTHAPWS